MATKQPRVAVDINQIARIGVFRRSDRLHRERPCLREFLRVEPRPEQRVCDQLHHEVDVAGQKARSDGEALGLGARRELAADALDRFGERRRVALAGALLQQLGEQRRAAILAGRVAHRAAAQQRPHGYERRIAFLHQHQHRTVREHMLLERREPHAAARRSLRVHRKGECEEERHAGRQYRADHGGASAGVAAPAGAAVAGSSTPKVRLSGRSTAAAAARTSSTVMLSYSPGASNSLRKSPWKTS